MKLQRLKKIQNQQSRNYNKNKSNKRDTAEAVSLFVASIDATLWKNFQIKIKSRFAKRGSPRGAPNVLIESV